MKSIIIVVAVVVVVTSCASESARVVAPPAPAPASTIDATPVPAADDPGQDCSGADVAGLAPIARKMVRVPAACFGGVHTSLAQIVRSPAELTAALGCNDVVTGVDFAQHDYGVIFAGGMALRGLYAADARAPEAPPRQTGSGGGEDGVVVADLFTGRRTPCSGIERPRVFERFVPIVVEIPRGTSRIDTRACHVREEPCRAP